MIIGLEYRIIRIRVFKRHQKTLLHVINQCGDDAMSMPETLQNSANRSVSEDAISIALGAVDAYP